MLTVVRAPARVVLIAGTSLALAALLGACASSPSASGNSTSSTSTTGPTSQSTAPSTTSPTIPVTGPSLATIDSSKTVTVAGKTVKVPIDSGRAITQNVADGQQIIISASGFLPQKLYSTPSEWIVWTNLTNQSERVMFDYFSVTSPVIPPGGTFRWKSAASESIAYQSSTGMHAVVVINPPGI